VGDAHVRDAVDDMRRTIAAHDDLDRVPARVFVDVVVARARDAAVRAGRDRHPTVLRQRITTGFRIHEGGYLRGDGPRVARVAFLDLRLERRRPVIRPLAVHVTEQT